MRDLIGNPFKNRRAQRLSELVDEADGSVRRHGRTSHDEELAQLAEVGRSLRSAAPSVAASSAPDPAFQAALRRRLMVEAAAQGIGATATGQDTTVRVPRQRTRRRFAFAALVAGLILGLSGVATASGDAVPGDALYPVKRTTERAQLAFAGSDVNRGQLYLEFARNRLVETTGLHDDQAALVTALADMDSDTVEGVRSLTTAAVERQDSAVLDALDEFTSQQRPGIVALMEDVGGDAGIRAGEALTLIDEVSERSRDLRNSLMCVADDTETDRLGPLPTQCSALPGTEGETVVPDSSPHAPGGPQDPSESAPGEEGDKSASESPSPSDSPSPTSDETDSEEDEDGDGDGDGFLSELGDLLSGLLGG